MHADGRDITPMADGVNMEDLYDLCDTDDDLQPGTGWIIIDIYKKKNPASDLAEYLHSTKLLLQFLMKKCLQPEDFNYDGDDHEVCEASRSGDSPDAPLELERSERGRALSGSSTSALDDRNLEDNMSGAQSLDVYSDVLGDGDFESDKLGVSVVVLCERVII